MSIFARFLLVLIAAILTPKVQADEVAPEFTPEAIEFFEGKVRPILIANCFACHSDVIDEPQGGLRLDARDHIISGGDSGSAAVPGDALQSLLIDAISYESGLDMPPEQPLSKRDRDILSRWIEIGLPWGPETGEATKFDLQQRAESHWAWTPPNAHQPPSIIPSIVVPQTPIDAFVLASLQDQDLEMTGPAERTTLLRRLYFDLIGIPPTVGDIERFLADDSPMALSKVVDRLLADPQFGVRWGRHWLDLVRYAETYGHEFDYPIPHAHRYRDYVVKAFNDDLPYNQFVTEQLAGDELKTPRLSPHDQTNQSLTATGFWWLGDAVHAPVDVRADQASRIDNQIDVVSKTFLGMTVACARCHDHKFDAISQADYYALGGLLHGTTRNFDWLDAAHSTSIALGELDRTTKKLIDSYSASSHPDPSQTSNTNQSGLLSQPGTSVGWAFEENHQKSFTAYAIDEQKLRIEPTHWLNSAHRGKNAVGTWRSAPFTITSPAIAYRVIGDGGGEIRIVIDGHFMIDYHQLLFAETKFAPNTDGQWKWHIQRGDLHHYLGHTAHIEMVDRGTGYVGLSEIMMLEEGDQIPVDSDSPNADSPNAAFATSINELGEEMESSIAEWLTVANRVPMPQEILSAADLVPRDIPLAIRGDSDAPGDVVPRGDLTALSFVSKQASAVSTESVDSRHNVGGERLKLAANWTGPNNPLLSRVAVNRIWHHLTGRGIVASTDNFGALGNQPTHPELLDDLSVGFSQDGWSQKKLIREIVSSQTYQNESTPSANRSDSDPNNDLLAHARLRRLEGEAIRDSALQLAGLLDLQIGGPSTATHLTETMTGRGRPGQSGPLDGAGRRSLFLEVRRNFLSPMMLAFDTPVPFATVGKRNQSNVPAQALTLLNDPFVRLCSTHWADRIQAECSNTESRITAMYWEAFCRSPAPEELRIAERFITSIELDQQPDAWRELAHALMNVKEFIFLP